MTGVASFLNGLSEGAARAALDRCCGSPAWVERILRGRPYPDDEALFRAVDAAWWQVGPDEWRAAFARHPRIGAGAEELEGPGGEWSRREQAGMEGASDGTRGAMERGNREYETRFGHVFLICATGRTAPEMLAELRRRLGNDPETELSVAAGEQLMITRLRLRKLVDP